LVAGVEYYEHDEHIPQRKVDVAAEKDAAAEDDASQSKEKTVEEVNSSARSPNIHQEETLLKDAQTPPETDSKADTNIVETEPEEHLSLEEKGKALPEILHIPFEDAVAGMKLAGWEDEWVAHASFDVKKFGYLEEPKIDFVCLWVNGSESAFQDVKRSYEVNSILNDAEGVWIKSPGTNRYRDWDELKYSLRSLETHASDFRNKIQILVNSVEGTRDRKQIPQWLNDKPITKEVVQVLAQEEFFDAEKHLCLPTFNSLTIENQIFNVSHASV
jgi:hypothetical protein